MRARVFIWGFLAATVMAAGLLGASQSGEAQTLERLIMPGPVASPHAKYEDKCDSCHEPFAKIKQDDLCLSCHKEVRKDLLKNLGFHGLSRSVKDAECKSCHSDHKGREFDMVGLDSETFDHSSTDYPLGKGHSGLQCTDCHKPPAKFREATSTCVSCHKSDDPHKGSLGDKCETCHSDATWTEAKFDHKKTDFQIGGVHKDVTCAACHPNQVFAKTPKLCVACHAINDTHGGLFGDKCESCHTTTYKWTLPNFDHDKKTDFKLHASHSKLACTSCHTGDLYKEELKKECVSCHRADDVHKGRNGTDCKSCHAADNWKKSSFDHMKTDFRLSGAHAKLQCSSCHIGNTRAASLGTSCATCHGADDVHRGQLGEDCASCHSETRWAGTLFDHDLTNFPLIGLHAVVSCQECHLGQTFKDAEPACFSCHKAEDLHKQGLGEDCASCHNPNGWDFWRFDHETQTDFSLDGAHVGLVCNACHIRPVKKKAAASKSCQSCHRADDPHRGQFGPRCETCHDTKSFKTIRMRR